MEEFKIELFKEESKKDFPSYLKLSDTECENLRRSISKKYNIDISINSIDFVSASTEKQEPLKLNAQEDFSLLECLESCGINSLSKVYINWYRFDDIDQFNLVDLVE